MARRISGLVIIVMLLLQTNLFSEEHDDFIPENNTIGEIEIAKIQEELKSALKNEKTDDIKFSNSSKGIILTDRTTGTNYRLYVSGGSLLIETVD